MSRISLLLLSSPSARDQMFFFTDFEKIHNRLPPFIIVCFHIPASRRIHEDHGVRETSLCPVWVYLHKTSLSAASNHSTSKNLLLSQVRPGLRSLLHCSTVHDSSFLLRSNHSAASHSMCAGTFATTWWTRGLQKEVLKE